MSQISIHDCSTGKQYLMEIDSNTTVSSLIMKLRKTEHIERHNKSDKCFGYKLIQDSTGNEIPESENIIKIIGNDEILHLMVDLNRANMSEIPKRKKVGIYTVSFIVFFAINMLLMFFWNIKTGYLINFLMLIIFPGSIIKDLEKKCFLEQRETYTFNNFAPYSNNSNTKFNNTMNALNIASEKEWLAIEKNAFYYFFCKTQNEKVQVNLPNGKPLKTKYKLIADRILSDLQTYGFNYNLPESILTYQFTLFNNLIDLNHFEIEKKLFISLTENDWALSKDSSRFELQELLGEKNKRPVEIQNWLAKCTKMQLAAVACLGNAYGSLNMPFCIAKMMEKYDKVIDIPLENVEELAKMLSEIGEYDYETMIKDFQTFIVYYGIHFDEKGKIIAKSNEVNEAKEAQPVTAEAITESVISISDNSEIQQNNLKEVNDLENQQTEIIEKKNILDEMQSTTSEDPVEMNINNESDINHSFIANSENNEYRNVTNSITGNDKNQSTLKPSPQVLFCRKCGIKLVDGSIFCYKCGTKIKDKED